MTIDALRRSRSLRLVLLLALAPLFAMPQARAADERCFAETGQCISGRFREYWEQNGGLAVFGYPVTAARNERNRDTGADYLTQWFERNRFELHPENAAPYDVLLGRLGDDQLVRQGLDWRTFARGFKQDDCLWFAETGHSVCNQGQSQGFRSYWERHGLQDPALNRYQRSLALFGLPISEPGMETNTSGDTVMTQWFERARLEWHPDKPDAFKVLLGLLGSETLKPGSPRAALPDDALWVHSAGRVIGVVPGLPTLFLPKGMHQPVPEVAPDGSLMVYAETAILGQPGDRLLGINPTSGGQAILYETTGQILMPHFSPSGLELVFTVIEPQRWQMMVLDRRGTAPRVLQQGSMSERVLAPSAWTTAGVIGQYLLWASDAPARDLVLVDPANGSLRSLAQGDHWVVFSSADGRRVARVSGLLPLGPDAVPDLTLSVIDTRTGSEVTLARNIKSGIWRGAWSPDGSKLLYVASATGGEVDTIHVVNADGTNDRTLAFGTRALAQKLRDVVWNGANTLAVLTTSGSTLALYDLPIADMKPEALRSRGDFSGAPDPGTSQIIYIPR